MSISVDPAWLSLPADRFRRIGADFIAIGGSVRGVVDPAAGGAGNADVAAGCAAFSTGLAAALPAFGEDARLLGNKVVQAAILYRNVDEAAIDVPGGIEERPADVTPGGVPR